MAGAAMSSVPAANAQTTVDEVVAACSGGSDCAAVVRRYLALVPAAQRPVVAAQLAEALSNAAAANPALQDEVARGLTVVDQTLASNVDAVPLDENVGASAN